MDATPGARTVLLLTLLGLAGCALIATVHPPEALDPTRIHEQAGRNVAVDLVIASARGEPAMLRGDAHPSGTAAAVAAIAWIWFRAPEAGPLPGDRVTGHAQVSVDARGAAILLDGPGAARIEPGPHPVPVHWDDLTSSPERLVARLLLVNGAVDGDVLRAPDGRSFCPLGGPVPPAAYTLDRHILMLERADDSPGWNCILE